jgi:hypothetical protein
MIPPLSIPLNAIMGAFALFKEEKQVEILHTGYKFSHPFTSKHGMQGSFGWKKAWLELPLNCHATQPNFLNMHFVKKVKVPTHTGDSQYYYMVRKTRSRQPFFRIIMLKVPEIL